MKLKIVCTTWQIMHWWDLFNALKDDADFYLIHNNHRCWKEEKFLAARPLPDNAHFVPYYEKGKYDLAILNVDQQVINPALGKSKLFRELNELITDIPKVIINHASPVYPEFICSPDMTKEQAQLECIKIMKDLVGDTPMVTNSYTAASDKEWGWGIPIWHGLDKDEWYDRPKEPRVFSALSPAGCDEYYNRSCMSKAGSLLKERHGHTIWWAKMNVATHESPEKYKEFLGRSLIYLDVSFRTPMNRARTEAMLSGCCVVQVKGAHDLDKFAKHNENIILVDNAPLKIADTLKTLLEDNYDECLKIGHNGRLMAEKLFNRERYRKDWLKLIKEVL